MAAPPQLSDLDLLGDCQGIIYFDAEIADGAFDLRMPEQELHGPQVAGLPVDQGCLGSAE